MVHESNQTMLIVYLLPMAVFMLHDRAEWLWQRWCGPWSWKYLIPDPTEQECWPLTKNKAKIQRTNPKIQKYKVGYYQPYSGISTQCSKYEM